MIFRVLPPLLYNILHKERMLVCPCSGLYFILIIITAHNNNNRKNRLLGIAFHADEDVMQEAKCRTCVVFQNALPCSYMLFVCIYNIIRNGNSETNPKTNMKKSISFSFGFYPHIYDTHIISLNFYGYCGCVCVFIVK